MASAGLQEQSRPESRIPWRRRLAVKVILTAGIVIAVIVGGFTWYVVHSQARRLEDEVLRTSDLTNDLVRRATRRAMLFVQRDSVSEIVAEMGRQARVTRVDVYDKEGRLMFSSDRARVGLATDVDSEPCRACHAPGVPPERLPVTRRLQTIRMPDGSRAAEAVGPIFNEPSCVGSGCHPPPDQVKVLGVIETAISLADVDREAWSAGLRLAGAAAAAVAAVAVALALLVRRFVGRPVAGLLEATHRVASGDYEHEVPIAGDDELANLGVAFNRLTASLHRATSDLVRANEELREWGDRLESLVDDRTRELRDREEQLIRSSRLASMGQLAASVAHEVNNPLSGILIYLRLMLKYLTQEPFPLHKREEMVRHLLLMEAETARCAKLVAGMLQLGRSPRMQVAEQDVNIVVEKSLALLERRFALGNVKVVAKLDRALPAVECDGEQIQQTVMGIALNAFEAMPRGGTLTVETALVPDLPGVAVGIRDTGIGIPPENLPKLFEAFFTTKGEQKGVGLGLSIAYAIVQRHQGRIEVGSRVGEGSAFTVVLPLRHRRPDEQADPAAGREGAG